MELARGDPFDRYRIEELLGEGGMARVYRAHDPRLHRRVALKVMRVDSTFDPDGAADASARVLREARSAAALDHPNVVSIFDVGEADGQLFIAMELVVGKSLRAYVGDLQVKWEAKIRWLVDAARALGAAHERGVVHRDMKPENVMVRTDGLAKVLDFGIAKRVRVDVQSTAFVEETRGGSVPGGLVGTPFYLSPEQLRGEPLDGRSDQFAWGVMAYELLTGDLPWPRAVDGLKLVLAILGQTPESPSRLVPVLPSIVDATIMKALSKTPAQRFDTMDALVAGLEVFTTSSRRSWADLQHVETTKTDPAPPLEPPSAPRPPIAAPATDPPPTPRSAMAPTASATRRWIVVAIGLALIAATAAVVSWITLALH